ncbi:MAG TPA: branched-chain amino acid ABC transporter permease [Candidatus Acidoferrum sp.]|nr:branched-chain amino acid ABC transporter permease [Candidatus Acidoferrum sp.]
MSSLKSWKLWTLLGAVIACAATPLFVQNDYQMQVLFRIALFAALGLAWNVVGGYAGQLSLGHVAFFGLGAYGLALFTALSIPSWISMFLAAIVATLFAAVIGRIVFRLRGPYFTLATIASAEVLRLVATNLNVTGGAIGLTTPALFTGKTFWDLFYLSAVALALASFLVNYWVSRSRFGYYLMAIREDEETASAVGIDTAGYKLRSLLISAFLTALAGALYGSAFQFIVPDSILSLEISIQIAIITMLGGAGTLLGPIVGAVLLLSASEVFKNQFKESHLLIYGILIVVVVLFLPEGIVGGLQHRLRKRIKPPAAPEAAGPPNSKAPAALEETSR